MKNEIGFKRFERAVAELTSAYAVPKLKAKRRGEVEEVNTGPAFDSIFWGFSEISEALQALQLIETLVGIAPPRSKKVKRDDYLKYLIGGYLQEMYILEQRLRTFSRRMVRLYKKPQAFSGLEKLIKDSLGGIVNTRGAHVHDKRYWDEGLHLLSTLSVIVQFKNDYDMDFQLEYRIRQKEWTERIRKNNKAAMEILDMYFDMLYPIMSKDGKIAIPRTGKELTHSRNHVIGDTPR